MLDKRGDASRRGAEREVDALKTLKDPEHGGMLFNCCVLDQDT